MHTEAHRDTHADINTDTQQTHRQTHRDRYVDTESRRHTNTTRNIHILTSTTFYTLKYTHTDTHAPKSKYTERLSLQYHYEFPLEFPLIFAFFRRCSPSFFKHSQHHERLQVYTSQDSLSLRSHVEHPKLFTHVRLLTGTHRHRHTITTQQIQKSKCCGPWEPRDPRRYIIIRVFGQMIWRIWPKGEPNTFEYLMCDLR